MSEYCVLYWAAACLAFWAGGGITKGQFADAVDAIVREADMTVPQEVLFKMIVNNMTNKGKEYGAVR